MAKILLVDYNEDVSKPVAEYLSWFGFTVDLIHDSSGVLEMLKKTKYDLIIMDRFSVPDDGCSVCKAIRKVPALAEQKIMLVAPEEPELAEFMLLKKMGVYFMNKYGEASLWSEKIATILRKG